MKTHKSAVFILLLTVMLAGCGAMREGMEGDEDVVAQADGFSLSVDKAAELLAIAPDNVLPRQPRSVERLVVLWVGYTVLASQFANPDTFADIDYAPLMQLGVDQELVWALRQEEILARAQPSDSALRESYDREQPYTRVEAQHILIRIPPGAPAAQADSLERYAESLRERALAGEDFAELARNYSDDPASAGQGGRLGWVERGRLVPEFEQVVFQLQPGEISETVRSNFGYHIIRVLGRDEPDFESIRESYLSAIFDRELAALEQAYIDSLFDVAALRLAVGAASLVRRLAISEGLERLSSARRRYVLARYRGGTLTLGEWADFTMRHTPDYRRMFASSDSAAVAGLRELVRNELLVKAARDRGYALTETQVDSLREEAIREVRIAAITSGIRPPLLVGGDSAIAAAAEGALRDVLALQRSPIPLDRVAPALWRGHAIRVHPDQYPAVIAALAETRRGGEPAAESSS